MDYQSRATSQRVFTLLRDLIHERAGIYFDENSMELMIDKLGPLMMERGIDSPIDYYYLLKYGSDRPDVDEWAFLLNAISVRETYFWREFGQIRALVDIIVPELASKLTAPLKIWSAACASGEEPLTLAMALDQAGWFDRIPIDIVGSDTSTDALTAAERGIYRERSFRTLPAHLKVRYFTPASGGWKIDADIHRRIRWQFANMTSAGDIEELARANIIFCRNVFIYFSDVAIRNTVKTFAERMIEPGYLCLGSAESLLKFTTEFELREIGNAFIYVKEGGR